MMQSVPLHKRLVRSLQAGEAGFVENVIPVLARLPVAEQDEAEKKALLRELRGIDRQHHALVRRVRAAAGKLERLPVVNALVN